MAHLRTYTALVFLASLVGACAPHHTPTHKGETAQKPSPAVVCAMEAVDFSDCHSVTWPEGAPASLRHEILPVDCPPEHPQLADCRRLEGAAEIDAWLYGPEGPYGAP